MKMTIKSLIAAGMGLALWLDTNFGMTLYLVAALLLVDAVLNYKDEAVYLQKLMIYLVSTGGAFYVQNASLSGIPLAKGLMIALAVHELTQVSTKIMALLDQYKAAHPDKMAAINTIEADAQSLFNVWFNEMQKQKLNQPAQAATQTPPKEGDNGE